MAENILDSGSTNDISSPRPTKELLDDTGVDEVCKYINGKKKYQCKICHNYFILSHLQYHVKVLHSEDNTYTCNVCGEVFKQKYYFNVHLKTHDDFLKPWKCETCDQQFASKYYLKMHQGLHSDQRLTCKICKKNFRLMSKLRFHEKIHTTDKKYGCEICGRKFHMRWQLKYHFKLHSFKIKCPICNRNFPNRRKMKQHKVIHTGIFEQSFSCPVCFMFFSRQIDLKKHIQNHSHHVSCDSKDIHSKKKPSNVCDICQKVFVSKSVLKIHKRNHTGEMPYTCKICKKPFRYFSTFKIHSIEKHDADANYRCEICDKGFYSMYLYTDHMNGHTGHLPHQCQICQRHFAKKSSFYTHMRLKHSTKTKVQSAQDILKYKCDFCGKSIKSPSERVIHMRRHTGHYPFRCDKCGIAFHSKTSRDNHLMTHSLPFQCGICHEKYSRKTHLLKHFEIHKTIDDNITPTKTKSELNYSRLYSNRSSFECAICHVHYRTRKAMLKHIATHKAFEKNTTESNSEINAVIERHALPYECGICHVQFNAMRHLLRHIQTHITVEENTSEFNHSDLTNVQGQPKPVNAQSERSYGSIGLKPEPVETSSAIIDDFEVLRGQVQAGMCSDTLCNIETSVMKMEDNSNKECNMNLTSVSPSGEQEKGCSTQSIPQIISLNHNEINNTAGNTGIVKSELHITQNVNIEQGRNNNVLVMKKIGSFKVSKEELEQILSRGTFVIKPEVSQNNA